MKECKNVDVGIIILESVIMTFEAKVIDVEVGRFEKEGKEIVFGKVMLKVKGEDGVSGSLMSIGVDMKSVDLKSIGEGDYLVTVEFKVGEKLKAYPRVIKLKKL